MQKFNCTVPWVPDPVVCNWTTPNITDVVAEYVVVTIKSQLTFKLPKVKGHSKDPDAGVLSHPLCDARLYLWMGGHRKPERKT